MINKKEKNRDTLSRFTYGNQRSYSLPVRPRLDFNFGNGVGESRQYKNGAHHDKQLNLNSVSNRYNSEEDVINRINSSVKNPFSKEFNEFCFSKIQYRKTPVPKTKHDHLLEKIKPSKEFFEKRRNRRSFSLLKNEEAMKLMRQYMVDIKQEPKRSILKKTDKGKKRERTVSFDKNKEVYEVENWKIYNVDVAKENPYFYPENKCKVQ